MSLFTNLRKRHGKKQEGMTRRDMLKMTLAASAGMLLSDKVSYAADDKRRVVVVGAGFAGLAAAHELISAGYNVTVVEARKRLGGRVLSFGDFIAGKNVEGGGELIGSNHPAWVAYAKKFNLEFLPVDEDDESEAPIHLGGKRLTADESGELWEQMDSALSGMNGDAEKIDAEQPWKSPDAKKLDSRTTADWIEALEVKPLCKLGISVQLASNNGVRTTSQSYLGNLAQVKGGGIEKYWTDSEVFRCKGGNQQLAAKLAAAIGDARILLGTAVESIEAGAKNMTVTLAGGKKLEADDVVLAVPPSVWKRIAIQPALPQQLTPQMGTNVKFLTALKGRFWKESKLAAWSLSDGIASMTWESTDGQPGDEGAGLTVYAGGPAAEKGRQLKPDERNDAYLAELEKVYPGMRKNFISARFMDWPGDPWTGAGFSFPAPGQVTTMGPILREGVGRLHFAGEHACYAFVGYMEGALNSGVAVASRLAKRDGIVK